MKIAIQEKKGGGPIGNRTPPLKIAGGYDGCPRALTMILDTVKITFRTVRDGHRRICLPEE
jgi:hypothetical protein